MASPSEGNRKVKAADVAEATWPNLTGKFKPHDDRVVAAAVGRGGRDRGQPSPHQGMSAQQPVLTPVLALGPQPTPGSEPH
jgi:hypothetical protein